MEKEKVLSQIAEVTNFVRDKAASDSEFIERKSSENKEIFERLEKQMGSILENQKKAREYVDAPLSTEQDESLSRGLLNGRMGSADYQRMLSISPNHHLVRSTPEAEDMKRLQDLHDAVAIRYQYVNAVLGMNAAIDRIARHPDTRTWAKELKKHGYIQDVEAFLNPKSGQLMEVALTRNNEVLSPLNTTQGMNNLTFTLVSSQLIDQVYVDLVIAPNLTRIPLTRAQMQFPKLTGLTRGIWGGVYTSGSTDNQETPATGGGNQLPSLIGMMPADSHFQKPTIGAINFSAEHILSYLLFNDDMLEDSIIPWLPFIRNELAKNIARAIDHAHMNGDTGAVAPTGVLDYASVDAAGFDASLAWHGLRWYCLGSTNGAKDATTYVAAECSQVTIGGALTLAAIESAIAQLGKYALQPSQCVYAVTPADYIRIMTMDQFKLFTNAGPSFTLRSGVVGQIYGIDVVPTDIFQTPYNLAGVKEAGPGENQTGGDIYGMSMMWRRDQFLFGMFDTVQVEATRWAPRLFTIMQADVRADMQPIVTGPANTNTPGSWPAVAVLKTTL